MNSVSFGESTEILESSSSTRNSAGLSSSQPFFENNSENNQASNIGNFQLPDSINGANDNSFKHPNGHSRSLQVAYSVNNISSLMGGQFFLGYPLGESDSLDANNAIQGFPCTSPLVSMFGPPPLPYVENRIPQPPPHSVGISLDSPVPQPQSPWKISTGAPIDFINKFSCKTTFGCDEYCLQQDDHNVESAQDTYVNRPTSVDITKQPFNDWCHLEESSGIFGYHHLFSSSSRGSGSREGLRSPQPLPTYPERGSNNKIPNTPQNPTMFVVMKMPLSPRSTNIQHPSSPLAIKKRPYRAKKRKSDHGSQKGRRKQVHLSQTEQVFKDRNVHKDKENEVFARNNGLADPEESVTVDPSLNMTPPVVLPLHLRSHRCKHRGAHKSNTKPVASSVSTPKIECVPSIFSKSHVSKGTVSRTKETVDNFQRNATQLCTLTEELKDTDSLNDNGMPSICASRILSENIDSSTTAPGKGRRISAGCWTCKLRRKRCDAVHPVCGCCKRLGIQCLGYDKVRPEYMTDPKLNQQMRQKISAALRENKLVKS